VAISQRDQEQRAPGAGQIIPRGPDRWLLRVFVGRVGGKKHYRSKIFYGTEKQAERELRSMLTQTAEGTLPKASGNLTFGAWLERWLQDDVQPRVRPKTYQDYRQLVRLYVTGTPIAHMKLKDVLPADLRALYNELGRAALSPRTVRYLHAVLNGALQQAVTDGELKMNAATAARKSLPKQTRREMEVLTPRQIDAFWEAARQARDEGRQGARLGTLFEFLVNTGCRPSEALALKWADLAPDYSSVQIVRGLSRTKGGQWRFDEPKTKSSRRPIPLPTGCRAALAAHRAEQEAEREISADWANLDLVFCTRDGKPLIQRNVVRAFKATLERAGLPGSVRVYDLRHSAATLMLAGGVHPKIVAERLGHSTSKLTLDTYSHVLPHMQEEATNILEALLYPQKAGASHDDA
jgi:integrase